MLHCVLRKFSHNVLLHHPSLQFLRHFASGATIKAESTSDNIEDGVNKNTQDFVEAVAISVARKPTVDASLRSVLSSTSVSAKSTPNKIEPTFWYPSPSSDAGIFDQYKKLSKFRLTTLVVITTMGGYAMAPAAFNLTTFILCSVGTGLVSAAANSVNQYHEVPFDSQMSRTKNRALVTGKLTPLHAIGFATVAATTGLSMLYLGVNSLTAVLGAGNLLLYTMVYTPMKRMSIVNTWIGSVVGAIPPLMGWMGCAGTLDSGAWILAGLLYAWQFPHFNALSWNLRPDYSRAGYRMMAVTNPDLCRSTALRYTGVVAGLSLLAPLLDVTNTWFALETIPLNAYFCYLAYQFYKNSNSNSSRKLFRFSLIHLPAIMLLFLFNKKQWFSAKESSANPDQYAECLSTVEAEQRTLLNTTANINQLLPVAVTAAPMAVIDKSA